MASRRTLVARFPKVNAGAASAGKPAESPVRRPAPNRLTDRSQNPLWPKLLGKPATGSVGQTATSDPSALGSAAASAGAEDAAAAGRDDTPPPRTTGAGAGRTTPVTPDSVLEVEAVGGPLLGGKAAAARPGSPAALRSKVAGAVGGSSPARRTTPSVPRLKVVLDMDECLIHSIFQEHVTPGRVPFGRPGAPPPSPPPHAVTPIDSFPLTMLDKATCVVNKRPKVDWFLEEVASRFETYVMTAGTRDYAEPLLDVLDPKGLLKGRFYRDSCVFHEGHYFKDLTLVDEDPRRVVLVDNNPASFVLCPANGIPVPSFYDDPADRGLEGALQVLLAIEAERDVRKLLRQMYGLEAKLGPLTRQFQRGRH